MCVEFVNWIRENTDTGYRGTLVYRNSLFSGSLIAYQLLENCSRGGELLKTRLLSHKT